MCRCFKSTRLIYYPSGHNNFSRHGLLKIGTLSVHVYLRIVLTCDHYFTVVAVLTAVVVAINDNNVVVVA